MTSRPVPTARPAFTLLEMILAAAITVLLLAALYVAVDVQLRHAATARDIVEQTTLARTLINRIANDIEPSVNLVDPSRFQSGSSSSTGSTGSSTTGATTGATGSTSTTGGSSTTGTASSTTATNGPLILLLQGTTDTLTIWVSRVPPDPNNLSAVNNLVNPSGQNGQNGQNSQDNANGQNNLAALPGIADTRRIDYWLAGGGGLGLARLEQTAITGDDAAPGTTPPDVSDPNSKVIIAPEVKSLQFQYFDGSAWQDSWDGTQLGADGVTPLGPPAAVAITIGLAQPDGGDLKMYRHVVGIQAANGAMSAQISSADGATTTVTLNSPSSESSTSGSGSSTSGSGSTSSSP